MISSIFFRAAAFCFVASSLTFAHAQTNIPGKGPAWTEPPKNNWDYELMGEFVGPIQVGESAYEPLGLQIRAIGGNAFEAIAYQGGLPGQPKHKPEMKRMIGRRSGEFLILSGGPWAVIVEKDHCKLVGRDGKSLGRLDRVSRTSPTLGAKPPEGAVVIFDGTHLDQLSNGQMTKDGLLIEGCDLKPMFQDFNMHVEFRIPFMPEADGQKRGNSGLYLQSRYESQVLDSFATDRKIDGLGALYKQRKADLNMAFPPLVWQTYDIQFTAPRWAADGTKTRNARITSWINGIAVQNDTELTNKTGAGKLEEPMLLPIKIQDHGDPVRFRNIWIVDRGMTQMKEFPVMGSKDEPKAAPKSAQPSKDSKPTAKKTAKKQANSDAK